MPSPRSSASCWTSTTVTGMPAFAKFIAMPPPIVPAPITAAFLISFAGNARRGEVAVHDLVDEADLERFVGADRIAAHDHRQGLLRADYARQPLRAAGAGQQAELHLGQSEARVLHADAIVTRERHLE